MQCLSCSSLFIPRSSSSKASGGCPPHLLLACFGHQQNGCLLLFTHLYHHLLATVGYKQNARSISIKPVISNPPVWWQKSPAIYGNTVAVVSNESPARVSSINPCQESSNHYHFTTGQLQYHLQQLDHWLTISYCYITGTPHNILQPIQINNQDICFCSISITSSNHEVNHEMNHEINHEMNHEISVLTCSNYPIHCITSTEDPALGPGSSDPRRGCRTRLHGNKKQPWRNHNGTGSTGNLQNGRFDPLWWLAWFESFLGMVEPWLPQVSVVWSFGEVSL